MILHRMVAGLGPAKSKPRKKWRTRCYITEQYLGNTGKVQSMQDVIDNCSDRLSVAISAVNAAAKTKQKLNTKTSQRMPSANARQRWFWFMVSKKAITPQ